MHNLEQFLVDIRGFLCVRWPTHSTAVCLLCSFKRTAMHIVDDVKSVELPPIEHRVINAPTVTNSKVKIEQLYIKTEKYLKYNGKKISDVYTQWYWRGAVWGARSRIFEARAGGKPGGLDDGTVYYIFAATGLPPGCARKAALKAILEKQCGFWMRLSSEKQGLYFNNKWIQERIIPSDSNVT